MRQTLALARPPEILLVEDSENDVILTREGFNEAKLAVNLHTVGDGEQCMSFLRKLGPHTGAPTPDLVLLDLNLPRKDGREVLAEIVADKALRHLPVVVMTTSRAESDIAHVYSLRCSSYIVKPVDFDRFVATIRTLSEYWFRTVVLPGAGS